MHLSPKTSATAARRVALVATAERASLSLSQRPLPPTAALMTSLLCCVYLSADSRQKGGIAAAGRSYRRIAAERGRVSGHGLPAASPPAAYEQATSEAALAAATVTVTGSSSRSSSIRQREGDSSGGGCLRRETEVAPQIESTIVE